MKALAVLFELFCLLVFSSNPSWFPWFNFLVAGIFMLICSIEAKKYYTRNNNS